MFRHSLVSFVALIAATPALAQTPDTSPDTLPGDQIVVTASRSGEGVPANQLGASVTVLDAEALEARQTRIVSDVLRDVPGVAVNRSGGVGGLTQIRIRGSESNHVLVLIDGIEVSDPYQGEYDFGTLIADPAARIEVLRGQQSSLYGSDAIGGVINYITLSGREAPGYAARIEGGSFGTISGGARAAGASGDFDYALSASYYGTQGYATARGGARDVGSDSVGATAKLNWTPSDAFKLSGVLRYSYTDAETNQTDNDPASPAFGFIIDSPGVHSRNEAFYGLLSAQFSALDGRWVSTLSGQFADTTRKSFTPAGLDYGDKGQRYKGSFTSSLSLGTEAMTHRLTGAVDVERENFQNITPSAFAFQGKRHTDNVGFVGQYELLAGDLSLGASVRYDDNDRFDDATTWRVQGSYRLPTGTRLRAAYGTGVKNPGYFELYGYSDGRYIGNPDLKPEKSKGWEAGIEQSFGTDDWATIGATYFDAKLTDEIFTDYPAPDYVATPANRTTDSKQHGIEAFASARPIPDIRFDLAYTWLKSEENGVREVRRPRHMGSLNTTIFSADQRFSGTLTLRYNGAMTDTAYIDPSYVPVTVALRDYVLVNLGADYRLSPRVALFGRVENLLDTDYEEIFSYRGAGRAAYGGVRVNF
ncbi:TonB-dependent receptor plug domain-containing protein [Sphingopyxis indica]|uniref:Vitamin B12 transporter n=1 Tax=Sphingopyxis indica TaxID=436663 RepID=A0A239J864_9SPHN|nr:TonB-dependent receptor [Sphingopyxis indica]SNT01453.1 vitamin B12 transporter [Sphingopyxis indica]